MAVDTPSAGSLKTEAKRAARSPWVGWLGRAGLVAQGVSFGIVGVLALLLALGQGGKAESREGALQKLAGEPLGFVLLVGLAIGFAGYAIWRLAQALFDRDGEGTDGSGLAKRALRLGKGAVYVALLVATIDIVTDGRGGGTNEQKTTAGVLDWPAGRWIVFAVGAGFAVAAAYQLFRAFSQKFMDDMETARMHGATERSVEVVGIVGLVSRGVVFGLIGWFLLKAAVEYDPQEAVGLDGALARLADAPYGPALLGGTAAGLIAFAVFSIAQARYARV